MKKLIFALVFLVGCSDTSNPNPPTTYHFVLTRPDGVVHKEWDQECINPHVAVYDGQVFVRHYVSHGNYDSFHIPNGWLIDWTKKAEKE